MNDTLVYSKKYSNKFQRDGKLVILPDRGILYVASDFHSNYQDYKKWLKHTNLIEKLELKEDVYGVILGDIIDFKKAKGHKDRSGDRRILDSIMNIKENLGEYGSRLITLKGNHEHEVLSIYRKLKKKCFLENKSMEELIEELPESNSWSFYKQFNFIERIKKRHFNYIKNLPLAILAKNGIVGTHAAPLRNIDSINDIVNITNKNEHELVWNRPWEITRNGYDKYDVDYFLEVMENSSILVSGHTPLEHFSEEKQKNGVVMYGEHQVILATSYGYEPGNKSYLEFDLSKNYNDVNDLRLGKEIKRLE